LINLIGPSIDIDQLLVEGAVKGEGVGDITNARYLSSVIFSTCSIQHYARVDGAYIAKTPEGCELSPAPCGGPQSSPWAYIAKRSSSLLPTRARAVPIWLSAFSYLLYLRPLQTNPNF